MAIQRGIPNVPTGSGALSVWAQWVTHRISRKLRFNNSNTVRVNETQNGYSFEAVVPAVAGGGGASQLCTVVYEDMNYIACTYNGNNVNVAKPFFMRGFISYQTIFSFPVTFGGGSEAVGFALTNEAGVVESLRIVFGGTGYSSPTVDFSSGGGSGATATLSQYEGTLTGAVITAGGSAYTDYVIDAQAIYPPYNKGDKIIAIQPSGGTGLAGTTLIDANVEPRGLMTSFSTCEQVQPTPTPTTMNRLFLSSPPFATALP